MLEMLDVAIGVIFVYLLLSLVCSALNEFIEGFLKLRAVDLEQGIRELLNDPNGRHLANKLYNHHLIYSLFRGSYNPDKIRNVNKDVDNKKKRYSRGSDLPSYIPSRNFALALMDVIFPATPAKSETPAITGSSGAIAPLKDNSSVSPDDSNPPVKPNPLTGLRNAVNIMTNTKVRDALIVIINDAGDDAVKARDGIENWYNSCMDRVAGWYKRRVQQIVFFMGFFIAIVMNVDTFAVFKNLENDRPLRSAIVAQAQSIRDPKTDSLPPTDKIRSNVNSLLQLGLPLGRGWKSELNDNDGALTNLSAIPPRSSGLSWFLKIIGWLVTGLAVSLGAPFWFDMLNKVMVVRSTVKPTEKSPDEGSEDKKKLS